MMMIFHYQTDKYLSQKIIKVKAREFTFDLLCHLKLKYRKLDGINYRKLEIQSYFLNQELSNEEKQTIFSFRTRMANFGENFRAGRTSVICPLCNQHKDSQSYIFECSEVKNILKNKFGEIKSTVEDINNETVCKTSAKILKAAMDIRAEKLRAI